MPPLPGLKYSKHRPRNSRKMRAAADRRKIVAEYRMKGWTNQADIARELGVHRGMICRDFQALDQEWASQATEHIARHKAIDLLRIEGMFQELWDKRGNVGVARTLILLLERKAKLLGLDAPTQLEITDWRKEARDLGLDPDKLFQDMVTLVGEQSSAIPPPQLIDLSPEPDPDDYQP